MTIKFDATTKFIISNTHEERPWDITIQRLGNDIRLSCLKSNSEYWIHVANLSDVIEVLQKIKEQIGKEI